jgi:hypothetical protein
LSSTPARTAGGVPPLAQAARNRVSVLVEVAGDPPVLVTQIALCDIGQLLPAHASGGAMNVMSKADAPLTWVQPRRQGGISKTATGVVLDSDELTRLIDIAGEEQRASARQRRHRRSRLVRYAVTVPSEANCGA